MAETLAREGKRPRHLAHWGLSLAVVFYLLLQPSSGRAVAAEEVCSPVVGQLVSLEGRVEFQRDGQERWAAARLDQALCQGDSIRVGDNSRAAASLVNGAVLRLDQNTAMRLTDIAAEEEERSLLDLIVGAFQSLSRKPRKLSVNTPYLNATIEGTEFVLRAAPDQSEVIVFEGIVVASNDAGELVLTEGQAASATPGSAPEPLVVVKPRDAVQWALYYPPILASLGGGARETPTDMPDALRPALENAGRGDLPQAFRELEAIPETGRNAAYYQLRAALLLRVGRTDQARQDIDRALALDPQAGLAYALRAVIAVVQNEPAQAVADGRKAVELDPESPAAKIALSYALQSEFKLAEARDLLQTAVEESPDDALAWARLSELWLMLGYHRQSVKAAERARALQPDLERVQIVAGYAALAEFDTTTAKEAFDRAIELDSADPLAWLGRGLAKIRKGDLEEGTRDLEIAVGLDANNALLRSYLGKAYFEEKRAPLDSEQFAIAKKLDPLDPTPYLYSAITKQTENRPGEALEDLQESIARNDNRAVYRGRLELDKDRAARGTSLGRIYDDLGFQQLGINEASKSLTLDPANASAHRFLSDIYLDQRRREIARVSDLLQAQLLQDININPIQPSISSTNLNIVTNGGPADAGFNEFTPLFESNGAQLDVTGGIGNDNTLAGEGVISGLYEGYSVSAGGFHFETDGYRDNNDIEHDIYDFFGQAALTPEFNVQAEFRDQHSTNGDIALNFDPDQFSSAFNRELDQSIARVGARYSHAPSSNLLASFIYSDREEKTFDSIDSGIPGFPIDTDAKVDDEGYQAEGQYIFEHPWFNAVLGGAYSHVDRDLKADVTFGGIPIASLDTTDNIDNYRGYLYTNISYPEDVTWTLGVSADHYEQDAFKVEKVSPKLGVQWTVIEDLVLRGAYFRTVKPALVNNRTLEPTQVAGFNQLFDDVNATDSTRYGVGVDWTATRTLFLGAEATWRDLDEQVQLGASNAVTEDRDEENYRAYLYWLPFKSIAVNGEIVYDVFESNEGLDADLPTEVTTFSIPIGLRYFNANGFFAGATASYVDQDVDRSADATLADGADDFFIVDASFGWRFPERRGIFSLGVQNVFDQDFKYQDDSYREFSDEPVIGPYIPERTFFVKLTLSF